MSFQSKGVRRYGHMPPVQYESRNGRDFKSTNNGLHRQPGFDISNGLATLDLLNDKCEASVSPDPPRSPISSQEDLPLTNSSSIQDHHSFRFESSEHMSPPLPSYQHEDLPRDLYQSSLHPLISYNPQNPSPEQIISSSPDSSYRSSKYHVPPPTSSLATPLDNISYPENSSHPTENPISRDTRQYKQLSYHYDDRPDPQWSAHRESPSASPCIHNDQSPIPTPLQYTAYNHTPPSQVISPLLNNRWIPYSEYDSNQHETSSKRNYAHGNSSIGDATVNYDETNEFASQNQYSLQRHPTLRPLPNAPKNLEEVDHNCIQLEYSDEFLEQEQLIDYIGNALGISDLKRQGSLALDQSNDESFKEGINASHYYQKPGLNMEPVLVTSESNVGTIFHGTHFENANDVDDEDDLDDAKQSDLEASRECNAIQISEEKYSNYNTGVSKYGKYEPSKDLYQSSDVDSIDDKQELMDLSSVGGGRDFQLSYGDKIPIKSPVGSLNDGKEQIISMPLPYESERSCNFSRFETVGRGNRTQSLIEEKNLFSDYVDAQTDNSGTGGMQWSTSRTQRLSFEEGDEQVPIKSKYKYDFRKRNMSQDEMHTSFFYPDTIPSSSNTIHNYDRPLPPVPPAPLDDSAQPLLDHLGKHQQSEKLQLDAISQVANFHGLVNISGRSGQYISRASSLSNYSSTPCTIPPVRSKTDAEERQARQKLARLEANSESGLNPFYFGNSPNLHAIDLPSLPSSRQKKLTPSKLTSVEFLKCNEPWALSSISSWIREIAGGETGEGESDLRLKVIEDALVALFIYFVPIINTADAETLSQRVVNSMLDSGLLVRDEEWIKFGNGRITGVLWQLTGSGCYSPRLHKYTVGGRCYSYYCTRTLKKINLHARILEPSRKLEDWITFYKLTAEQVEGINKKEIQRQNNLHEIVTSEDLYMDQINILRILYRDQLLSWNTQIIGKGKLQKFVNSVFGKVQDVKNVNENYLLAHLKYRQKEQGPWIVGFSDIFREWIRKAKAIYIEYAAGFPNASYLVRKEADKNLLFRQFLDQARENKLSSRLDWNTYLKAPITRLQRYSLLLGTVLNNMTQDTEEKSNLVLAIEEIKAVTLECDTKVDEQTKKVQMLELRSKLRLRPGMSAVELNLDHLGRKLIFQGDLQRAGTNRFTWLETHAILLDNYFILAKTISKVDTTYPGKKEAYDVSKLPIPMELLVLESTDDDPVIKSSVKGISTVTNVTKTTPLNSIILGPTRSNTDNEKITALEPTISNQSTLTIPSTQKLHSSSLNESDTRLMYPFRVKHLGKPETYTLYAPSAQSRLDWRDKILQAKTEFTESLHRQNFEPFKLRIMADSAFASDSFPVPAQKIGISVKGTPLDRAIREIEIEYSEVPRPAPICRAQVNCATTFHWYGRLMVAIGTDLGVFISEESNPRGWTKSISPLRVTQISILEEFSICLIISDKALIAYPLEIVVATWGSPLPPQETARRAPMKLSGTRDVSFFATSRMKNRTLIFYKKREGLHSTFKVLEPVFHKSSERKSRLLGKLKGGSTEFFRHFDEFYIPTECFTINLFQSYIAISSLKGFELMTLDKKVPTSIPDTKDPAISSITARLAGQKPLGMFRLSALEFLLCYEECGVYVDKHGDVSRSVVMEFVGKAKTAAIYGIYLVLFDNDFVEIRNAQNGRLRQVIAGREVRCLDCGVSPQGIGATTNGVASSIEKRSLKFVMAHPEVNGNQLILEMILNEGYSE